MAPEQIEGARSTRAPTSSALGVLLYECMVGHLPFEGNNPAQVLRRVLDGVYPERSESARRRVDAGARILDRALARSPADRFADANAMREAIAGGARTASGRVARARARGLARRPEAYVGEAQRDEDRRPALRARGRGAQAGRRLAAAADYNRALALAPGRPAAAPHRGGDEPRRAPRPRAATVRALRCGGDLGSAPCRRGRCGSSIGVGVHPGDRPAPTESAPPPALASAPPSGPSSVAPAAQSRPRRRRVCPSSVGEPPGRAQGDRSISSRRWASRSRSTGSRAAT